MMPEERQHVLTMTPIETAVCIGFDAMRIALGKQPKVFTAEDVMRWLALMLEQQEVKNEHAARQSV